MRNRRRGGGVEPSGRQSLDDEGGGALNSTGGPPEEAGDARRRRRRLARPPSKKDAAEATEAAEDAPDEDGAEGGGSVTVEGAPEPNPEDADAPERDEQRPHRRRLRLMRRSKRDRLAGGDGGDAPVDEEPAEAADEAQPVTPVSEDEGAREHREETGATAEAPATGEAPSRRGRRRAKHSRRGGTAAVKPLADGTPAENAAPPADEAEALEVQEHKPAVEPEPGGAPAAPIKPRRPRPSRTSPRSPFLRALAARLAGIVLAGAVVGLAAALSWSRVAVGAIAGACGAVVLVFPVLEWRWERRSGTSAGEAPSERVLDALADPALSDLKPDQLLREVLARVRLTTGAEVAALFLVGDDSRTLRVTASHGKSSVISVGTEIEWGTGAVGGVADSGRPALFDPLTEEERAGLAGPLSSLMAAPMRTSGRVIGVLVTATAGEHHFEAKHLRLLEIAAWRYATSIEHARLVEDERRYRLGAEHARLHLGMLARAGLVLSRAMYDYDEALGALAEVVVPDFADWFCVELVDDSGELRRVSERSRDDSRAGGAEASGRRRPPSHRHPEGSRLVRQAVDSGRPRVVMPRGRGVRHGGEPATPEDTVESTPDKGVESMLVVPIRIRGLSMGALTFVTEGGRRGYRRSDLETAEGLANRVGVAVERVLSWRQLEAAQQAATVHATRLQALMEAALVVSTPLAESEVLDVLVEHAHRVVDAEHVVISAAPGGGPMVEREWSATAQGPARAELVQAVVDAISTVPKRSVLSDDTVPPATEGARGAVAPWIAVALRAEGEGPRRVLMAFAARGRRFTPEDESVLGLLAQMASEALQSAHLYDVVRANQDRLQAILDSSPLPIAEVDLDGTARWWNRAAAEMFGWAPDDARKQIPARDSAGSVLAGLWERSRRGDATVGTTVGATSTGGEQLELSVSTAPLRDVQGTVTGALVVAEDITERNQLIDRFHQAERLSAMARMAGGMAHDFNNLLTVILGCSEILMDGVQDEALVQEVTAIQRAGQRAAALTGQLLAIGQRRTGQPSAVVLDDVVCAMEPMLGGLLGEDVALEVDPGAAAAMVSVDQGELERAVLNLAINARDAMPDGGRLVIKTQVEGARGRGESGLVGLVVSDTGVGMDVETREHCFEPFFTTKGLARGTGLGLATVHATITQAGGQITVESAPGKGTSFTLWFPVLDPASIEQAGPETADEQGVLLFVEDEAELRRLSTREFERRGYTIVAVSSAEEATRELEARQGDVALVITDIVMPGQSGLELRQVVSERYPEVPVLLISGNVPGGAGAESIAVDGEVAFLAKPFTPEQLLFRVRQILMTRPSPRQQRS